MHIAVTCEHANFILLQCISFRLHNEFVHNNCNFINTYKKGLNLIAQYRLSITGVQGKQHMQ